MTRPAPGAAKRPLVLIVDDHEKNRKLVRDVLGAAGFGTLEASTGAESLALATEYLPDVILMDLRLPDMDGGDAARKLGAGTRTARIPVVALSSIRLGPGEQPRALGFAGYVEKPFSVRDFPEEVRSFCTAARG